MNQFFLVPNLQKKAAVDYADELKAMIESLGGTAEIAGDELRRNNGHLKPEWIPADTECIITLGGDGTILQAARALADLEIPIFGINLGTLGFLAEADTSQCPEAVRRLISGQYLIEDRMMLRGRVLRDGKVIYENLALNDITVHAEGDSRAVSYELQVNGGHLNNYFADGMIICTPTGSTGYNLSSGGPIVMPSADLILATAINPHTLMQRSVVLPDTVRLSIRLTERENEEAAAFFDGSVCHGLRIGDEIEVEKAEQKIRFIKLTEDSFIEVLRTKMEN